MIFNLKPYCFILFCLLTLNSALVAQVQLAFQGGEPGNSWSYTSSGTDATALAQANIAQNYVSGTKSIVVGGNTGGGSCIDGGGGNGVSAERFFTFSTVDISSSNSVVRSLSFHWGSRFPACVGAGWDSGENLIFTPYYNGIAQPSITIVSGNNNASFSIQSHIFNHFIPPCVNTFSFNISIITNRRDELLFLDNVTLSAPQLNTTTQLNLSICQSELPYNWNGLIFTQAGSQTQILTNSFGCDSIVQQNLSVIAPTTPSFNQMSAFCSGQNIPPLPTVSLNNISGNWTPSINNQQTTTYTFSPNPGQCATSTSKTIPITPIATPAFTQVGPYCEGAIIPALPTTSSNGIAGQWSPQINNSITTTYTFTPNTGQCAVPTEYVISITPNSLPIFSPIPSYCQGGVIPNLPSTSLNNISGTWTPAINNNISTNYTFTPNSGICAWTSDLTINIEPNQIPQFNAPGAFCPNASIPNLPTTSVNNITGTWSPSINNQQTTTYTFTPISGICATTTNLTIPVELSLTPLFDVQMSYCLGDIIPELPTTSANGINGSWSPGINQTATTTYTFTPFPNQCAIPADLTIVVNNYVLPQFSNISPYCSGSAIPELPTVSINNVSGNWTPQLNNAVSTEYSFVPDSVQASGNHCALSTTTLITIIPSVTPTFPYVAPICEGGLLSPLPTISQNGISGFWSPAINNQQTTNYTFVPTSGICSQEVNKTITVVPIDSTYFNVTICQGQLPFSWQGLSINNPGIFYHNYQGTMGCNAVLVLNLEVIPNTVINYNITLCQSDFPYTFSDQNIPAPGIYEWTTNQFSGCDTTFVLHVGVHQPLNIWFNETPSSSCNESLNMSFSVSGSDLVSQCLWSMNEQTSTTCGIFNVQLDTVGCYDLFLTATDLNGCNTTISQTQMVCIYPNPVASFALENSFVEAGEVINPINLSEGATNYYWNFGTENGQSTSNYPQFVFSQAGQYTIDLTAVSIHGCVDSYYALISVSTTELIYLPNAFTPGGGDLNEIFLPVISSGVNPYKYKLIIFNRWGEIMFESRNLEVGWDGTYNGQLCPSGVYIWQMEFENGLGVKDLKKGHFNLLR